MGDWWVYENLSVATGGRATIHNGMCPYCKHGKGIHPNASDQNGRWYGPFANRDSAYTKASKLGRTNITYCTKCRYLSES